MFISDLSLQERHQNHKLLVLWATECAEHVLSYFEEYYPEDDRPRKAIEAGRAWVHDEIATGNARAAAFAAHAAARDANVIAACAAARAAGHAAATAHVTGHARHAANYAVTAAVAAGIANEREWQYQRLPEHLRSTAFPTRGKYRL
jgi:hypothetical protein